MIELSVFCQSDPSKNPIEKTYTFNQSKIVIGKAGATGVDVHLENEGVGSTHLIIIRQASKDSEHYILVNATNDPFVSINDLPFGKRRLQVGDLVTLGSTTIRCKTILLSDPHLEQNVTEKPASEPPPQKQELPAPLLSKSLPERKPPKAINAQTKRVQEFRPTAEPPRVSPPKSSLKDDYLREYDDESDTNLFKRRERGAREPEAPIQPPKNWTFVNKYIFAILGLCVIFTAALYIHSYHKARHREIEAAKSMSDVAMALTHAQVHRLQPQKNNWIDPEFIKENLKGVLAPQYSNLAVFDSHGQLTLCPYKLRIYTSNDNTQFIVIAQPEPSFCQWMTPRSSLIIHSEAMEIRKIDDLKTINRILVNAPILEEKEQRELFNAINKGKVFRLIHLHSPAENDGFVPPASLAILHPGSENFIYNAPRYYLMGERLIDQLITGLDKPAFDKDLQTLRQEFYALSQLPHFVFYSSKGLKRAMQAQKALTAISNEEQFLLAYGSLDEQGKMMAIELLPDASEAFPASSDRNGEVAFHDAIPHINEEDLFKNSNDFPLSGTSTSRSDPFLLQLNAIIAARTLMLKPLNDEITTLIAHHTGHWDPDFALFYPKAFSRYSKTDEEQKEKIINALASFVHEHRYLAADRFVNYVAEAKGMPYFEAYLERLREQQPHPPLTKEKLQNHFREITLSMSWLTLNQNVEKTAALLTFESIPNVAELISIQNEFSSRVIQKLNQFLLSSNQSLPADAFSAESRNTLIHIMENAWIDDPETHGFYLSEFDQRRTGSYK